MHPMLRQFLDRWVYPTGFTGPGVEFRLRQTERCIPAWDRLLGVAQKAAEEESRSPDPDYTFKLAVAGYASEGPQMSIKQMSAQLLSISIAEQEKYIDLQRMRARQIWDEVKHGQLHADILLRSGRIKREEELMTMAGANLQGHLVSYFGQAAMFPHFHPLARAAQHYFNEAAVCMRIIVTLEMVQDPLVRHGLRSQEAEELMHFMEGKYQMDAYALTPEDQKPIEQAFDFLLKPWVQKPARSLRRRSEIGSRP